MKMKKTIFLICSIAVILTETSCNKITRLNDSEISAIRDQTIAIEKLTVEMRRHNQVLEKILSKSN